MIRTILPMAAAACGVVILFAQQPNNSTQEKQGKQEKQTPRGITVAGEVKNYVPVTDAMLHNPDPADWLMIRGDYKANSFSTLNQINTQNVHELRLVWSWAMQEGAVLGNQPAPIVHNGVLYVNNNGMVLQALDAKTGELIWENRYGTRPNARSTATTFSWLGKPWAFTDAAWWRLGVGWRVQGHGRAKEAARVARSGICKVVREKDSRGVGLGPTERASPVIAGRPFLRFVLAAACVHNVRTGEAPPEALVRRGSPPSIRLPASSRNCAVSCVGSLRTWPSQCSRVSLSSS
jgi:hypothetical protein